VVSSTILTSGDKELVIDEMLPKLLPVEQIAQPERPNEAALFAKPSDGFGRARGGDRRGINTNQSGKQQRRDDRSCYYCGRRGLLKWDGKHMSDT